MESILEVISDCTKFIMYYVNTGLVFVVYWCNDYEHGNIWGL